jgi:hypothetical protein
MPELTKDIKLLRYLSDVGIGQYKPINEFLDQLMPVPKTSGNKLNHYVSVTVFLQDLIDHKFIKLQRTEFQDGYSAGKLHGGNCLFPAKATILQAGMDYLGKKAKKDLLTKLTGWFALLAIVSGLFWTNRENIANLFKNNSKVKNDSSIVNKIKSDTIKDKTVKIDSSKIKTDTSKRINNPSSVIPPVTKITPFSFSKDRKYVDYNPTNLQKIIAGIPVEELIGVNIRYSRWRSGDSIIAKRIKTKIKHLGIKNIVVNQFDPGHIFYKYEYGYFYDQTSSGYEIYTILLIH